MRSQVSQAFRLLYRYPAFGRLWIGRSISLFGDAFTPIALSWFVLQTTGSGTATAGILLTLQLPAILTEIGSRSVLPELVEDKDLDAANMLWSFSLNLSLVIGPAVAGVLI